MDRGKIYIIPISISENTLAHITPVVISHIHRIKHYAVERARTARRFISSTNPPYKLEEVRLVEIGKHQNQNDQKQIWAWLDQGYDLGIMSESGMPGIADPGQEVIKQAHEKGIHVIPLTGPSSILLALGASGMNGQNFRFAGYLPIKENEVIQKLKELEKRTLSTGESQIFIETPYRNDRLMTLLTKHINDKIRLCISADITGKSEYIKTKTIKSWKSEKEEIGKRPCIFILGR